MGANKVIEEFSVTLQSRPSVHGPVYITEDIVKGHLKLEIVQHLSLTCKYEQCIKTNSTSFNFYPQEKV